MTRNFDDLFRAVVNAIPSREEMSALSDEDLERLRKAGNLYDNALYLEVLKRREGKQS